MGAGFRTGDVLGVSCPYTEAEVTGVSSDQVSVRWPWWEPDPECEGIVWNGDVALVHGEQELFATDPAPAELRVGATCRVGIPPTVVHVLDVHHFDLPLETGRLPRPRTLVTVLHQGQSQDRGLDEQGYEIALDDGIPIALDLLFRPYAFLEAGDELADRRGRAWRFDGPWSWHPFDRAEPAIPDWPLALLTRDGREDPEAAERIARATGGGSHDGELARWTGLTHAEPSRQ